MRRWTGSEHDGQRGAQWVRRCGRGQPADGGRAASAPLTGELVSACSAPPAHTANARNLFVNYGLKEAGRNQRKATCHYESLKRKPAAGRSIPVHLGPVTKPRGKCSWLPEMTSRQNTTAQC